MISTLVLGRGFEFGEQQIRVLEDGVHHPEGAFFEQAEQLGHLGGLFILDGLEFEHSLLFFHLI